MDRLLLTISSLQRGLCQLATLAFLLTSASHLASAESKVSYAHEIQPLLAARCFACHGPDQAESGLALHEQASAYAEPDSGSLALIPGKPDESELLRRISSRDANERMPRRVRH